MQTTANKMAAISVNPAKIGDNVKFVPTDGPGYHK